eukprot:4229694-Pyramimonas_sp.AAC.1
MKLFAPNSVHFSTNQSTLPPFRDPHATATSHCGPTLSATRTSSIASTMAPFFPELTRRVVTRRPLPSQSSKRSPSFSRSARNACLLSTGSKLTCIPGPPGRGEWKKRGARDAASLCAISMPSGAEHRVTSTPLALYVVVKYEALFWEKHRFGGKAEVREAV